MEYKLIISPKARNQIDSCVDYIVNQLMNSDAAIHLSEEIIEAYDRISENPYQFQLSPNSFLAELGYRRVHLSHMSYHFEIKVEEKCVDVDGFFHDLESYPDKLVFQIKRIDDEEEE